MVQGTSLSSTAFQQALYAALRTLIDNLGMSTFNVGIMGINATGANQKADFQREGSLLWATSDTYSSAGVIEAR